MTAAAIQALAAETERRTLLVRGTTDQAHLMGFVPVLPKERP